MHKLDRCKLRDQKVIIVYQKIIKEGLNCCNVAQSEMNSVVNWTQIKESTNKAAVTLLDSKRKSKNHWFDDECQEEIMKRKAARIKMIQNPSTKNVEEYTESRTKLK